MPSDHDHFMIDIETYDVTPSAVILSIGAERILGSETFYVEVDPNTQYERTVSQSTKDWWTKQSNPPINGITSLHAALTYFAEWLPKNPIIWCKGTDFDITILAHAYRQYNIPIPWKYSNVRDCRTVYKLAGHHPIRTATHNALEDAEDQTDNLILALTKLRAVLA